MKQKVKWRFREKLRKKQKGKCYYCQRWTHPRKGSLDHLFPKSRGGTNHPDNFVFACIPCNQAKGNMLFEEFVRSKVFALILERTHVNIQTVPNAMDWLYLNKPRLQGTSQ